MKHWITRGPRAVAQRWMPTALAAAAALALVACGGGGDAGAPEGPPVGSGGVTLTGIVATGMAVASASVEAKCNGGSGSATTAADGGYSVSIASGAALPCVLKVVTPSGTLYSLATGSGSTATAHVTPVTMLAMSYLTAGHADTYFASFDANAAAALTSARVQESVDAVKAALAAGGIDLAAVDVLAGPLVAAHDSTAGNVYDQALDALSAQLTAADTTLAALATTLAAQNPAPLGDGMPVLSGTASLPADLLLKPKAPNCTALRSGSYRSIDLETATTQDYPQGGGYPTLTVSIDAAALTVTDNGETITLIPAGDCRYTVDDGQAPGPDAELIVSAAGVITVRYLTQNVNGIWRASLLIPVQNHTLAELAGDWNVLGFDRSLDTDPHVLRTSTASVSATGAISNLTNCTGLATGCASETTTSRFTADGAGGFYLEGDSWRDRLYAYRAGGGELMLVIQNSEGMVSLLSRKLARALPAVGDFTQGWQFNIVPSGTSTPSFTAPSAVSLYESTVVSVDSAQQSYVRNAVVDNTSGGVTRPETLEINSPRDGFLHRLAASNVLHSDGGHSTVSEWVGLPMRGMGFTAVGIVSNNQLYLSTTAAH